VKIWVPITTVTLFNNNVCITYVNVRNISYNHSFFCGGNFNIFIICDYSQERLTSRRRPVIKVSMLKNMIICCRKAIRDMKALDEELTTAEQNLLKTMEQERLVTARLADRTNRPPGETTKDEVDRRLRDELGRLKHFIKHLRNNIERIMYVLIYTVFFLHLLNCLFLIIINIKVLVARTLIIILRVYE
jgi:hypothetical protein